ncbi:MAG: hypothetical protein QW650_00435 [Thermofilum sp.]
MVVSTFDGLEDAIEHYAPKPSRHVLFLYNMFGDLVYQFSFEGAGVKSVFVPFPFSGYFVGKIVNLGDKRYEYVVFRPREGKERYLFVFSPASDEVEIEGKAVRVKRKLRFLFEDLAWCDVSDLEPGKYVVRHAGKLEGVVLR